MSTELPPSGQDPYDPRHPERLPPGFVPPQGEYPRYPAGPEQPAGSPAGDPLVATDLPGWFERIIGSIRRSLAPLLILQAAYAVVNLVFQLLYGDRLAEMSKVSERDPQAAMARLEAISGALLLPGLVITVISLFVQAASMYVIIRHAAGGSPALGAALGFAARRMPLILAWAVAAGLLVMIGLMLFIVPGVYLMIVFFSALAGAVVVERRGIDRAFPLANRRFLPTAGRLLLFVLFIGVYSVLVNLVISGVGSESFVGALIGAALGIPIGLAQSAFFVVTYAELRHHENPVVLTPQLATEMES